MGYELVFPASYYFDDEAWLRALSGVAVDLLARKSKYASFELIECDQSWLSKLILGAIDYYDTPDVKALQIVPKGQERTIDVPDMSVAFDPKRAPVWRWLTQEWTYDIDSESTVATNLAALRGEAITEGCRWESDYWELFAGYGPDVSAEEARIIPLTVLLGADNSLEAFTHVPVGGPGLWRDRRDAPWNVWGGAA